MNKGYIAKTLSLYQFKRPSFFEGMARVLDLGHSMTLRKVKVSGPAADAKAIASDWEMLGQDLKSVMGDYGSKPRNSK